MNKKGQIIRSEIGTPTYKTVMSFIVLIANNEEISNDCYNLISDTIENMYLNGRSEPAQYLEEAWINAIKIQNGERENLWD